MSQFHPWWPDGLPIHPHLLFEVLGYTVGFQAFLWLRRRGADPVVDPLVRLWLFSAALVGGALGSRLLFLFEDPGWTLNAGLGVLAGGKSIVGGLLGAVWAVEAAKVVLGHRASTGDVAVVPVVVGLAVGRLGCFFSGVTDGTHGLPTTGIFGFDLGDGVPRHATAAYEIAVLLFLGAVVPRLKLPAGGRFSAFLTAYLLWRLGVEELKTQPFPWLGLSAVQVACGLGLLGYTAQYGVRWVRREPRPGLTEGAA